MTDVATATLAPDPQLPRRDTLLDPAAAPIPFDATFVEVLRCKYRVGESLRVLYRCDTPHGERLVSVRATAGRRDRWWIFPDDRRLPDIAALLSPSSVLVAMTGGRAWARSEVAEYAPERSITVRAIDASGRPVAYAKQYADGQTDVGMLSQRYAHVAGALPEGSVPRPLGWSDPLGTLVLEAMPGIRLADDTRRSATVTATSMGRAIAAIHRVPPPPGMPAFVRLEPPRVERAAAVIATARPDVAAEVRSLAGNIVASRTEGAPVLLHGDCHPKNAIVDGDRLALVDLDQAGTGAAAADIGSLLARLRVANIVGTIDATTGALTADAFLAGYRSQRALPSGPEIRWHTAAALLVEQALRAVNRVRGDVLIALDELLDVAADLLPRGEP